MQYVLFSIKINLRTQGKFSISLALIQPSTEKVGTCLVVKLQAVQQLTILVIFFQIRRV